MSDLETLLQPPDWWGRAACKGMAPQDPDNETHPFFAPDGSVTPQAYAACTRCPVTDECWSAAMDYPGQTFGVWGGMGEKARKKARRGRPSPRHCERCDTRFAPVKSENAAYCSAHCRKTAANQRKAAA